MFLLSSCGYVKTSTFPKYFKFEKEVTFCITVQNYKTDFNIVSNLNYSLKELGLNTIKYSNALKAIEYKNNPLIKLKNEEVEDILSVKDFNSIYEIRIQYKKKVKGFSNDFKAWVIDLNTNKVVLHQINSNDKSIEFILNSLAQKLSEKTNKN